MAPLSPLLRLPAVVCARRRYRSCFAPSSRWSSFPGLWSSETRPLEIPNLQIAAFRASHPRRRLSLRQRRRWRRRKSMLLARRWQSARFAPVSSFALARRQTTNKQAALVVGELQTRRSTCSSSCFFAFSAVGAAADEVEDVCTFVKPGTSCVMMTPSSFGISRVTSNVNAIVESCGARPIGGGGSLALPPPPPPSRPPSAAPPTAAARGCGGLSSTSACIRFGSSASLMRLIGICAGSGK